MDRIHIDEYMGNKLSLVNMVMERQVLSNCECFLVSDKATSCTRAIPLRAFS